jgi:hypothetical protein
MRDSLDAAVGANLHLPADLEVIEGVFDSVAAVFMQHANDKTAATALGAMVVSAPGRETYNWLKSDYSGLRPEVQRSYEASLAKIGRKNHTVSAFTVFAALASGFDGEVVSPQRAYPEVTVILQNYVAEVTDLWRAQGLHPTRATHPENPEYKSRFHVFVDLILSAVAEPWTDRYTGDVEELRNKAAEVRASLPDDIRKECAIMRQYNSGLLISEDILRKGLKRSIQKPAQKTP